MKPLSNWIRVLVSAVLTVTVAASCTWPWQTTPKPSSPPPTARPTPFPSGVTVTRVPALTPKVSASPRLTFIAMKSETDGWGLSESSILRTTDGGNQWFDVTPQGFAGGETTRGYYLDANTAWELTLDPQDFSLGILFRTNDGGQSWQSASVPFPGGVLQFTNPQTGWALYVPSAAAGSAEAEIYQTTDGGGTWNQVYKIDPSTPEPSGGLPFAGMKNGLTFLDERHGWVTGTEPKDGYAWLFATQDGTRTWQHQDLKLPSGFITSTLSIDPPRFSSAYHGILPVVFYRGKPYKDFYSTYDGGASWNSTMPVQNSGIYDMIPMRDIWVWDGTTLDVSHDGGQTWTRITPNVNLGEAIRQLDFISPTTGFVLTMDENGHSQLLKTTDGGSNWVTVIP